MTPVIYQLPHSPYCLPVCRALEALGVAYEAVNISNADRAVVIRLTDGACYQVPVLDDRERNRRVYEGSEGRSDGLDVARYLDQHWGHGRLFPNRHEGMQALLIPHIEGEIEGTTFKLADIHYVPTLTDLVERTMVLRHKERRFGRGCVEQWRDSRAALATRAAELVQPFDTMLREQRFLLGDTPVYADFALHGVLGNLTFNGWNPLPPGDHLVRWFHQLPEYRYP